MKVLIVLLSILLGANAFACDKNKAMETAGETLKANYADLAAHLEDPSFRQVTALYLGLTFDYNGKTTDSTTLYAAQILDKHTGEVSMDVGQILVLERNNCVPYVQLNDGRLVK